MANVPTLDEPVHVDIRPQSEEEYIAYTKDFVENNIENFVDPRDESIKAISKVAAAQADIVTAKFGLSPNTTPGLVKLAFYDFVILCGQLISSFGGRESFQIFCDHD